ncbi:MAG: hypothetical protein PHS73_00730 [Candidatus Peribacteraceae bacterium]|nr:hypothetical protein [Candidatus Peribacteraceae bacterium]
MSIAHPPSSAIQTEMPPNNFGDGFRWGHKSLNGDGTVIVTMLDTVRHHSECTIRETHEVDENLAAILEDLHQRLTARLNSEPMQVGVFPKGSPAVLVSSPGEQDETPAAAESIG